jgi:hypothetical protein
MLDACLDFLMGFAGKLSNEVRVSLLLFLLFNFFYLVTSSGRVRTIDEVTVDYEVESLVTRGSTAVPQAVKAGTYYGKVDSAGNPQAPYGAGQAVLVAPWYLLGRLLRAVIPGIPPQASDLVLDAVVTASSATFAAVAAALVFLLLARKGVGTGPAVATTFLVALATPLFAYSSWFYSEPMTAALLLGVAFSLFATELERPISWQRASIGGLFLGIALWVRPAHVMAIPVFLLAILVRERGRGLAPMLVVTVVAAAFAAAYLLRNHILFGNPFDFGYPATAEGGKHLNSFETPVSTGLFGFLLSPGKSIFLFAPPVLLAFPGLIWLGRRDRGLAVAAALLPLVYLLFYSRYSQWEGGYCFGPRYLVPVIPLLCLGAGALLENAGPKVRWVAGILGVTGFVVQAVGMSTSFLEDQAGGTYYDQLWNYRLSYAPLISQSQRLLHYLSSAEPSPIGRGFDRWFVFLAKAGLPSHLLAGALFFQVLGLFSFTWLLSSTLRRGSPK